MNFYYDLPAFSTGGCSDSKLMDEQAIMEATLTLYSAAIRGGNMIHDIGYLESGLTGSLELVVICDEIISWLKDYMKGLEINQETLALDLIHEHALKGDFLGTDHTVRHVRDGWKPRLVDRNNYENWKSSGGTTMCARARSKIDEILNSEPRQVLTSDVKRRIRKITEKVKTTQTM